MNDDVYTITERCGCGAMFSGSRAHVAEFRTGHRHEPPPAVSAALVAGVPEEFDADERPERQDLIIEYGDGETTWRCSWCREVVQVSGVFSPEDAEAEAVRPHDWRGCIVSLRAHRMAGKLSGRPNVPPPDKGKAS